MCIIGIMEKRNKSVGELALHYPQYAMLEMKFWISQQAIIPEMTDHVIEVFLHSCNYSLQETKNTILAFYSIRLKMPQIFLDRNIDCVKFAAERMYCVKLPGATEEGYKIFLMGLCNNNSTNFSFSELNKFVLMAMEMWLFLEEMYPGIIVIADSKNFTFSHLKQINVSVLRAVFQYYQDALATRLRKIIIINVSTPVDILLSMTELIISKKLMQLIEKHGKGSKKYLDLFPENSLPVEYGGKSDFGIQELQNETVKQLEENIEWFQKEDNALRALTKMQPRRKSILEHIFSISAD